MDSGDIRSCTEEIQEAAKSLWQLSYSQRPEALALMKMEVQAIRHLNERIHRQLHD